MNTNVQRCFSFYYVQTKKTSFYNYALLFGSASHKNLTHNLFCLWLYKIEEFNTFARNYIIRKFSGLLLSKPKDALPQKDSYIFI